MHDDGVRALSFYERRRVRQLTRFFKRETKHRRYAENGLNGPRAVARRASRVRFDGSK